MDLDFFGTLTFARWNIVAHINHIHAIAALLRIRVVALVSHCGTILLFRPNIIFYVGGGRRPGPWIVINKKKQKSEKAKKPSYI